MVVFKKIILDNFLVFSHVDLELEPGINIVHGPNEKGKSSIVKGVLCVIFGITKSEKELYRHRNSNNSDKFGGMIEIEYNNIPVTIERNFATDKTTVTENNKIIFEGVIGRAARATDKNHYLGLVAKYLFVSDQSLFGHLFCIEQGGLARSFEKDDMISLKDLIPRASEHRYSEVLQEIIEDYYKLTRVPPSFLAKSRGMSKDRDIELVDEKIRSCRDELVQAESLRDEVFRLNAELDSLNSERMAAEEEIYSLERESAEKEKLQKILSDLEFTEKEKKLYQIRLEQLDQLEEQQKQVQDQIMEEDSTIAKGILPETLMSSAVVVLSIALSLIFPSLLYVWIILMFLTGSVFMFFIVINYRERRSREKISARLLLEQARVDDLVKTLPSRRELTEMLEKAAHKHDDLVSCPGMESPDPEFIKNRIRELSFVLKEKKAREQYMIKRIAEISGRLSSVKIEKSAYQIQERMEELKEYLGKLEFRRNVLENSARYLSMAIERYVAGYIERTAAYIGERLPFLTDESYQGVCIGEDMDFRLVCGSRGSIDSAFLSYGARDMAWYLLRLALINNIIGDDGYFVFLDDPFVHIDPERRKRIFNLLDRDKKIDQVILFTYDEWYLRTCRDIFDKINIIAV
ncbi:MAG: AAA family ATPase [Oligoflexia bacterium]|nr:AAA family ATPase [Oligoflexia bacterium]